MNDNLRLTVLLSWQIKVVDLAKEILDVLLALFKIEKGEATLRVGNLGQHII